MLNFERIMSEMNKRFDIDLKRSEACIEVAIMEASINIEEAEYKMICENGTEDDLDYMLEEAEEGFVAKIKAALKKILDAVVEFFKSLRDKIVGFFSKKETDEQMKKMEQKAKTNPLFRNKKIEIDNTEEELKLIDKYKQKLKTFFARVKSGNSIGNDEIDDAEDSFLRKHGAIIAGGTVVTIGVAIALLRKRASKVKQETDASEKEIQEFIDKAMNEFDRVIEPEKATLLQKIADKFAKVGKKEGEVKTKGVTGLISKIKGLFNKRNGNAEPEDDENTNESAYDSYDEDNDTYMESSADDLSIEFDNLLNSLA